jgi:D-glycero-beta-D-manno-heptose 1-phosphate adenylyltransferase
MYTNKKKIVSKPRMVELAGHYRGKKQSIVFTNGCFDILHAGHVTYLNHTAKFGDILILGLNSDMSVKLIKGDKRPVIGEIHRAQVVAALECIDHVVIFDEPDPGNLIESICPDILVKGSDWSEDKIIGTDFVKNRGGKVERVTLKPDLSTTLIIQRIGALFYE